jgi:hypothetical protein
MSTDLVIQEIASGEGMPLAKAARRFPPNRNNRPVTLSCVLRWVLDGVRANGGEIVKLEAARCAGRWLTTASAIQRFLSRQTPDTTDRRALPRPLHAHGRASEQAARELERHGIR